MSKEGTPKTPMEHYNMSDLLRGQASKIITSLMSYGYLNAHEDSEDARVLHISITDRARELGLLLHANKSDFYTRALKGFSEEEIAQIDNYINRINANLGCNK